MTRVATFSAVLFTTALLSGCGGGNTADRVETVPVSGTLTVDGKPHGPANLTFKPITADGAGDSSRSMSAAMTAADGTFTVGTYEEADGLPPGTYEVSVVAVMATDPASMGKPAAPAVNTIPMTIEIPAGGSSDLKVELASSGGGGRSRPGQPLGL